MTYFINVRLVLNAARRIRLETSVAAMEQQMEVQAQSYLQLTQSIETSRALRHDLASSSDSDDGFCRAE